MRGFVTVIMLCAVQLLSAQIRIIPQDKLLSAEPKAKPNSSLQFATDEVSFGTIDEMSGAWQGSAVLTNVGTETIAITQTKTTCGCLQAELPKRVLAPKESVKVALKYYPRGHAGRVLQRVLLYANGATDQPSAILKLCGTVTASADRSDDYPYTRGALRLRQDELKVEREQPQRLRVACMNGGSTVLRPMADTLLMSKALKVRFEPAELAPKQEGNMVVEYMPTESTKKSEILKIYINGLNLSPRHCVVDIKLIE